jgi:hypothetical protein
MDYKSTVGALLNTAPWIAAVVVAGTLTTRDLNHLLLVWLGLAVVAVAFIAFQIAAGGSAVKLFRGINNIDFAGFGFFANKNHQAIWLVCMIPISLLWLAQKQFLERTNPAYTPRLVKISNWQSWALVVSLVLLVSATVALSASRAAFLLLAFAICTSALVWVFTSSYKYRHWLVFGGVIFVISGAIGLAQTGNLDALERLSAGNNEASRTVIWNEVIPAIELFWPVGAGGDALARVLLSTEAIESMDGSFINRAHNEYLGIALEHGLAGLAWLAAAGVLLLLCLTSNILSALRNSDRARASMLVRKDLLLVLPLLILSLHSIVDYPLRTSACAIMFVILTSALAFNRVYQRPNATPPA